ncbi:GNAT family N-acetyltransferase [Streptomyces sp. TP-A0874]|uniref:GNAT family N-acetyltransferase n=1 Tax=Streptomyces sp. TP-A0874 TaxID=549819 RepID=UPI000852F567|nr:GNAT family N-acetyltransferase [Streptomyces sp. TP-A0874]
MTTTLRPTGPEHRGPAGARSRDYEIRVNSRPVGAVRLVAGDRSGLAVGRIAALRVEGPERRRGRATVAALAAEEVLRGWGCRRIEITVPASAHGALRMADGLGYRESSRGMSKRLPRRVPEPPAGSVERSMLPEEFAVWLQRSTERHIRSAVAGGVPEAEASARAAADLRVLLPEGLETPGARFTVLARSGVEVGLLWLSLHGQESVLGLPGGARRTGTAGEDGIGGAVLDIEVAEEHRGRGHGRELMLSAERQCRAAGVGRLALNVSLENLQARGLYESLGYVTARHSFYKTLL